MTSNELWERLRMSDNEPIGHVLEFMGEAKRITEEELASGLQTEWKTDNTPVTQIDTRINARFIEFIEKYYPRDAVIGEEASKDGESGSKKWVIDPIDGTQGLEAGLPTFTVCIARLDADGRPEFSVVMNPSSDDIFISEAGKQTTLNGEPIHVSDKAILESAYVYMSSRMPAGMASFGTVADRLLQAGAKPFNVRSVAFGCLEVARGTFAGAFAGVKTPFEIASIKLIVEGAGGKVTDLDGKPIERCDGEVNGFVVSNGKVHNQLVELMKL